MASPETFFNVPHIIDEALAECFEQIYARFIPVLDESAATSENMACLAFSAAFRFNIIRLVESLHSDVRLRLCTHARVNQLPDDVLINILSVMPLKELVKATHVCHRWRKVAIETPALWTRLDLTGAFLVNADELFARSKAMPLDISITVSSTYLSRMRRLSALVASHIGRTRTLSIKSSGLRIVEDLRKPYMPPEGPLPAPILTTLHLDTDFGLLDKYFCDLTGGCLSNSLHYPALQEAYVLRGLSTVRILSQCTQLRVLVLCLAKMILGVDVLRLLRDNPALRDLELRVPPGWTGDLMSASLFASSGPLLGRALDVDMPLVCGLERFAVLPLAKPTDELDLFPRITPHAINLGIRDTYLLPVTTYFVNRVDCSAIPCVEIACSLATLEEPLGSALLGHMQGVTAVKISGNALHLQDSRGYTRRFYHLGGVQGPLDLALPFIEHVRVLELSLEEWQRLHKWHGITELACLEDLNLHAHLREFAIMERGIACPALRSLTLTMSHSTSVPTKDQALTVGKDVALCRLEMCPPLQSLTIVREIDDEHIVDETLHFAAPLPLTVFLTSAVLVDDLPELLDVSDSSAEDSAWASVSDSESDSED